MEPVKEATTLLDGATMPAVDVTMETIPPAGNDDDMDEMDDDSEAGEMDDDEMDDDDTDDDDTDDDMDDDEMDEDDEVVEPA
ncbi:MAG: hypothetical protein M3Q45_03700 [Chloroflexota bacterium]|nr:hypothetical protein [Chloroflexota bacterium]